MSSKEEAEALSETLAISWTKLREDEGAQGIKNIPKALAAIKSSKSGEFRKVIASCISSFQSMLPDDVKLEPFKAAIPAMCEIIQETLLAPDDDDKVPTDQYDEKGFQGAAYVLASTMSTYACMSDPYGSAAWGPALNVLEKVSGVKMKAATPLKAYGCQISRLSIVENLLRVKTPYGSKTPTPSNAIDVYLKYVVKGMPTSVANDASSSITTISSTDTNALKGKGRLIFAAITAGADSMKMVLISTYTNLYKTDADAFHDNIDLIMTLDFMYASGILYAISTSNGVKLVPIVPKLVEMLEKGNLGPMEIMVLQILNGVAAGDPNAVYAVIDKLYPIAVKITNADATLGMLLAKLVDAKDPGAPTKVLKYLMELLQLPTLASYAPATILSGILNVALKFGDNTKVLDPYMPIILKFKSTNAQIVEKIEDWHAGRSLENVSNRLDALEAKINAMNAEFSKQCKNFEEVSAMMDKKIADLKDFVGEIVKKLPQPSKLTVVGGVRKTLILHFTCAKSGADVTTETKAWNQWVKIGFGLIKLGKCAAEVAGGNAMALTGGVGAIKDIYSAYKEKDDSDFNTFISQPFLTSAEQDRLIEQLRDSGFFEKMAYDAQLGDWILVSQMSAEQKAKKGIQDKKVENTAANQEKVKGKNHGLGGVGDIAEAAIAVADEAGLGVGGTSIGEIAGAAADVASGAKIVASSVTTSRKENQEVKSVTVTSITQVRSTTTNRGMFSMMFGGRSRTTGAQEQRIEDLERRVAQLEAMVKKLSEGKS